MIIILSMEMLMLYTLTGSLVLEVLYAGLYKVVILLKEAVAIRFYT